MSTDPGATLDVADFARHFDHHSPEYGRHMHEIYDYMRRQCPVTRSDRYNGFWVLTRYEDIVRVARDDEAFSSAKGITIQDESELDMGQVVRKSFGTFLRDIPFFLQMRRLARQERPANIPIDLDPPRSKQFRKLLDPLVSPKAIKAMEPEVANLATELTDAFIERGEVDLALELAQPLTGIFTIKMVGLPVEDWKFFAEPWHKLVWRIGEPVDFMVDVIATQKALADEVRAQRKKRKDEGLISYLLDCELDGRKLANWEIESIVRLFIVGGVDTTQALLGSAWVYLGRHPERREELIADLNRLPDAVEELLRYFAPQQALCRTATRDVEIGGNQIRKGDKVLMCWASGNFDSAEFDTPEEIDFKRTGNRHLTFGMGSHRCMGSNLARLEAKVCMEQVLMRLPDYRLVEDGVRFAPDVGTVYGYSAVPVTFTPGRKVLS